MAAADFAYRIAETREDVEGAVRLVYHNYIEQGYCRLNRFQVHFYLYDVLPETRTLVAVRGDQVVATLTLVFDSPLGLPSGKLYPAELDALRRSGRRAVEISKLAVDRDLGARGLAVLKGIFRLAWLAASRVRGMTDFVIMVEPHHERFYANSLLFERLGELRPDPDAADAPSVLLRLDLERAPERHLARFGEAPKPSNPYWFFCLAPEVAETEAAARQADGRLSNMNRLLETGRKLPSPTPAERRYMDYRLFSIAFVTDKTCTEAERRSQKGLFREELEAYDRLLAALPPDYAPERRGRVLIQMAKALWHGGMYERTLALADTALELVVDADLRGDAHHIGAIALHFLGRRDEARARIGRALEDQGLSNFMAAKLLRMGGRFAVDRLEFAEARRSLYAARSRIESAADHELARMLRAYLAHDLHVLEYRSGQVEKARAELEAARSLFESSNDVVLADYHEGLCKIEALALRPRAVLEHTAAIIEAETPDSSRYNAAIPRFMAAEANRMLGRLAEARRLAEQALAFARASRQPSITADSVRLLTDILLAADDLAGARRVVDEGLAAEAGGDQPRARAILAAAAALPAIASRQWDRAREFCQQYADILKPEPALGALALCARVEVELLAGSPKAAGSLAEGLPPPEAMPGYLAYEARFRTLRAVLLAQAGDDAAAEREFLLALELFRPGGCLNEQAEAALLVLEALSAGRVRERSPKVCALAESAARGALEQVKLPACARRLADLAGG